MALPVRPGHGGDTFKLEELLASDALLLGRKTYQVFADSWPSESGECRCGSLGAEVPACAPPDFAEPLARVGMPLVPVGQPVRPLVTGATPSAADLSRRAAQLVAAQFDIGAAAAERCDALVAIGVTPAGVWR